MTKTPADLTPDGRYLVMRGRLWRTTDPSLDPIRRQQLVDNLMDARRAVRQALRADDPSALREARAQIQAVKEGLGERGSVWWNDGAPDYNRHLIKNTPYAGVDLTRQFGSSD
jgi:hypothetical protein